MTDLSHCKELIDQLTDTLSRENEILRSGTLTGLEEIVAVKLTHTTALDKTMKILSETDRQALTQQLQKLNNLSQENGLLLQSIANGAEAARKRLDNVRKQEASIGAYGQDGQGLYLSDSGSMPQKTV